MEAGTNRSFSDSEGLHIRAGNGGNLSVSHAGNTEDLGLPGKITERNFTLQKSGSIAKTVNASIASDSGADTNSTASKKTAEKRTPVKKQIAAGTHEQSSIAKDEHIAPVRKSAPAAESGTKPLDLLYRYND